MMPVIVSATRDLNRRLRAHLFGGNVEQVAFLLAEHRPASAHEFRLLEMYAVPAVEFKLQTPFHVSLVAEVRPKVIKWAWDRGACLVEAHSHRGRGRAAFSPSDVAGLREFVPHVWWRLQGRPYAALVFTRDTFDALTWIRSADQPEPVEALRIDRNRGEHPTNLTYQALTRKADHDR